MKQTFKSRIVFLLILCLIMLSGCSATGAGKETVTNKSVEITLQDKKYTGTYSGSCTAGIPSGDGEFTYKDDSIQINYKGNFENGQFSGSGTLSDTTLTINVYTSNGDYAQRVGPYTGDVTDGIPNGKGDFTTKNSVGQAYTYSGAWENGLWNGEGTVKYEGGRVNSGNYTKGAFTPSPLERMVSAGTNPDINFFVSDKAKAFLSDHPELFSTENKKNADPYTDYTLELREILKNPSDYGDKMLYLSNIKILQIWEETADGTPYTILNLVAGTDKVFYSYYFGTCDFYEGDTISAYGLPVAVTTYANTYGGKTFACILALSYIE